MKVELDLSVEQLSLLDKSLKDCLLSLTDEQKIQLLQNYINDQLESFREFKTDSTYWGNSTKYVYTDFGKQVIEGLSGKIEKSITKEMLNNKEIKQYMNEVIEQVKRNLQSSIEKAISDYIVNNLFFNKEDIREEIRITLSKIHNQNY